MSYRHLTHEEISILISRNCSSDDWTGITVREEFSPNTISNTCFTGTVRLGKFNETLEVEPALTRKSGIFNSSVSNCDIGNNAFISDVKNLSNYIIEEDVVISNVGTLVITGETTFGNGTEIEVLNEGGGRDLPIFEMLSSQTAYLAVMYRHDSEFVDKLLSLVKNFCNTKRSGKGRIQKGARITNSLIIRDVSIGRYASISGASLLEEGTIQSCMEAPAYIGEGVIAKRFIVLSGSKVDGGAIIDRSFIGQGVKMGKQYSAENSVFFANSEAFHGEACSLFAGPYAVTHHKSTLMIASLVSFFNAGSGTNQSNHMYKLGPLHQGILERGSKTGSFSYLLLPAHIGPFTVVMGKHTTNFDASDFPFSYISEEKGRSELTPAMNLFTVGTRRDSEKWPKRDRRKDPDKLDLVHFGLFSPYIVGKMMNGIQILNELAAKADKNQEWVSYKGISIRRLLLKTTRKYYEMGLKIYIGQEIVKRLENLEDNSSVKDLRNRLKSHSTEGEGKWLDICGMFAPASRIEGLIDAVKSGKISSVDELNESLAAIHKNYDQYAWEWLTNLMSQQFGDKPENLPIETLIQVIADWKVNAVKLNNMILKDAEKEFDPGSKIGFGLDGDENTANMDFISVRGLYDNNKFVIDLQKESQEITVKADMLISRLQEAR